MNKRGLVLMAITSAIAPLTGCALTHGQQHAGLVQAGIREQATVAARSLASPNPEESFYEVIDDVWVGSRPAVSPQPEMPAVLQAAVDRSGQTALTLPEVAAWLSRHYGVQVNLADDVLRMQELDHPLVLSHQGNVGSFLDLLAARAGVSWRWSGARVELFVRETRAYQFDALPFSTAIDNTISNVNTSGNSGSAAASGSGAATGITTSSGQTTALNARVDPFEALVRDIEAMVDRKNGSVIANRFLATVSVTDTPQVLERVGAYIKSANVAATRQVQFSVKVLSVELDSSDSYGINWNMVYRDLNSRFGISTELLSNATNATNSATISLLNPNSRFDGSQVLLEALSEQGEVSVEQSANLITLNGRPAPIQVTEDTAYLPSVTALQVPNAGATTSFQGATVTTGFAMRLTPLVRANDDVIVQLELNLSNLRNLRQISPGLGLTAEQPEVDRRQIAPQVLLRSGATMVLSGFEQTRASGNQRGIGSPRFQALGGGTRSSSRKSTMVVLITPVVI